MGSKYICTLCDKQFNSYKGVAAHWIKTHNKNTEELRIILYGEPPICKCGCGNKVSICNGDGEYNEYIKNHHVKGIGFYTRKGLEKSAQTRRARFKSGEIKQWNTGTKWKDLYTENEIEIRQIVYKDPIRNKKISDKLTGRERSVEHNKKLGDHMRKYWSDPKHREEQRNRKVSTMQKFLRKNKSKLEEQFENLLISLDIKFIFQYNVNGYNYDFLIPNNMTLIEVHGDWWHCNPKLDIKPVYESQIHTVEHDSVKLENIKDSEYKLVYFWEHDIKHNLDLVKQQLLEIAHK